MRQKISVIIPAKNEEQPIANCLKAVRAQTVTPSEILIVDGHSTDKTVEVGQSFGARVVFEDYGTRGGACQVGIENAKGDLIAFTDADCVPDPQWLEKLLPHLSGGIVGVGGRILNEGESFWQQTINVALDTVLGSANSIQGRNFPTIRLVSSISGCNSMYRKEDLQEVGGFRTELVTAEDTELNRRLLKRGKLLYAPDAVVHHRHQRGLRDFGKRMFQYGYGRGQAMLPGAPLLLAVSIPALILLAILSPVLTLFLLGAYTLLLFASSVWTCAKKRRFNLLAALPLTYLIEHTCYAAGFWTSILAKLVPYRLRGQATRGNAL